MPGGNEVASQLYLTWGTALGCLSAASIIAGGICVQPVGKQKPKPKPGKEVPAADLRYRG